MQRVAVLFALFVGTSALVDLDFVLRRARSKRSPQCLMACAQILSEGVGDLQSNPGAMLSGKNFKEEQLDTVCTAFRGAKDCFKGCNDEASGMIMRALKPIDYMCVERFAELKSHLPCYEAASDAVEAQCGLACGNLEEKMAAMRTKQQEASLRGDVGAMVQVMGENCEFLDCHTSCQEPIVRAQCPEDPGAATFMQGFVRNLLVNSEELLASVGVSHMWPQECRDAVKDKNLVGPVAPDSDSESEEFTPEILVLADEEGPAVDLDRAEIKYRKEAEKTQPQRPTKAELMDGKSGSKGVGLTLALLTAPLLALLA